MLPWLFNLILRRTPRMLRIGERAPDFALLDQEGRTVSRQDLAGKRFVLWFYPRAGTPG